MLKKHFSMVLIYLFLCQEGGKTVALSVCRSFRLSIICAEREKERERERERESVWRPVIRLGKPASWYESMQEGPGGQRGALEASQMAWEASLRLWRTA